MALFSGRLDGEVVISVVCLNSFGVLSMAVDAAVCGCGTRWKCAKEQNGRLAAG